MIQTIFGTKGQQSQRFLEDGTRIPVTRINVSPMPVLQVKTGDANGYWALKVGISQKKRASKSEMGEAKGIATNAIPRFLREIRIINADVTVDNLPKVGDMVVASAVLKVGDIVDVVGVSKGKGFAGVVKRHGFKGGPRTHGQSDRERAPGSIGQTTTPGRVYKGKRMAGRMGTDRVTVKNLKVVEVSDENVLLLGLVPGVPNGVILIKKVGEDGKFVPLLTDIAVLEEAVVEAASADSSVEPMEEPQEKVSEVPPASPESQQGEQVSKGEPDEQVQSEKVEKVEVQEETKAEAEPSSAEASKGKEEKLEEPVKEEAVEVQEEKGEENAG